MVEFLRSQRAITEVPLKHNSLQDVAQYLLKAVQERNSVGEKEVDNLEIESLKSRV